MNSLVSNSIPSIWNNLDELIGGDKEKKGKVKAITKAGIYLSGFAFLMLVNILDIAQNVSGKISSSDTTQVMLLAFIALCPIFLLFALYASEKNKTKTNHSNAPFIFAIIIILLSMSLSISVLATTGTSDLSRNEQGYLYSRIILLHLGMMVIAYGIMGPSFVIVGRKKYAELLKGEITV